VHTPTKTRLIQLKNDDAGPATAPTPAPWRAPPATHDPQNAGKAPAVDPNEFPAMPAPAADKPPDAPKGTVPTGRTAAPAAPVRK